MFVFPISIAKIIVFLQMVTLVLIFSVSLELVKINALCYTWVIR